jgi:hypothetical protein
MRKILLGMALAMAGTTSAQNYNPNSKNTLEVNVNLQTGSSPISFDAPSLRLRRFIKDDIALRAMVAVSTFSNSDRIYDPGNRAKFGVTTQNNWNFNVGLGAEKHIKSTDKLSVYLGGQLMFATGGGKFSGTNTTNGFTYVPGGEFKNSVSGGFGFGLLGVFGADYYFTKNVYLGSAISFGYTYQFNGYQLNWNNQSNTATESKLTTTMGLGIAVNPGVRLGVRF